MSKRQSHDIYDTDDIPVVIVPPIEENIPLPSNATEAFPDLSPEEELLMRAKTIKLLADFQGKPIEPDSIDAIKAQVVAKQMMTDRNFRPEYSKYSDEMIAFLAGCVSQMNVQIVDELADLKLYVINNLVKIAETAKDDKSKLTALTKLGEIDGVDAFKKRSEVVHKVESIEEVEKELLKTLQNLKERVIDVEFVEIPAESAKKQ